MDETDDLRYNRRGYLRQVTASMPGSGGPPGGDLPFLDGFESGDVCAWSAVIGAEGTECPETVQQTLTALYDSEGNLRALDSQTNDPQRVLYFAGAPIAIYNAGPEPELTLLTTDHLGMPIRAMDAAGTTMWLGGFEPFGRDYTTPTAAESGIFLRFPGQWSDAVWQGATQGAEVDYNVHRWLEPPTGRYASVDPFHRKFSSNPYAYVRSRPMLLVDPLGLFEIDPSCDCPPSPLESDDVYRAVAQARNYHRSAACQKILASHPDVRDCLGPRFGPEEIGKGPRIVCKANRQTDVQPCGEYQGSGSRDGGEIRLFPGHSECPRFIPSQGLGQTLFHETVHSCGLRLHDETFRAIVVACTGAE